LFAAIIAHLRVSRMAANILVVDDDRLNRELISKVLRQEGHRVVEACDGAVALEIFRMLRFDLVITDFVMPKLNGIKFVEQLHSVQPQIPIIFITGYLSVISGKSILDEVAEVLPKPFELDVLRSTVQHLLRDSAPC
jgi:CheY-like chemotaxis protein